MDMIPIISIFVIGALFGAVGYHFVQNTRKKSEQDIQQDMELAFSKVSKDALNENIQTFLSLAEDQV